VSLCASVAIGLHIATAHFSPGYDSFNPGVYAVCDAEYVGPVVGGVFRNSEGRGSVYVGKVFKVWEVQLVVGAVTGYERQSVFPMIVPSVLLWDHLRLSLVIPYKDMAGGVNFAWEF
jgi:hypothetical protein